MKKEVFAENDRPFPQIADRQDEWLQVSSSCSREDLLEDLHAVVQHVLCAIKEGREDLLTPQVIGDLENGMDTELRSDRI